MSNPQTRIKAQSEIEPLYDNPEYQPKTLTASARRGPEGNNPLYIAGRMPHGCEQCEVMFVSSAVQEEEAQEVIISNHQVEIRQIPAYLKGPAAMMFKDTASYCGLDLDKDCYYTALVKHLLPRAMRSKPSRKVQLWGEPVLRDEIKRVKPKIIVCLGKPAFDLLYAPKKISMDDAAGAWFWSESANAHLYLMQNPSILLMRPEFTERFRIDLAEVARRRQLLTIGKIEELPIRIEIIKSLSQLDAWVDARIEGIARSEVFHSVDCEWHGNTHIDGWLRSLQSAWTESDAMYLRFRDENNRWDFDLGDEEPIFMPGDSPREWERKKYAVVGKSLGRLFNRSEIFFFGHHYGADAPWMSHWLNLEVYGKLHTDTEFAQQCVDESSELGLERGIAMRYTTLGRYDIELVLWKKENKALCEDGYGYIPESILVPYACLAWDSKVQLGDGSWEFIHKLVQRKYDGEVKALVNGEVKNCQVTGWKQSKVEGQPWFRIATHTTRGSNGGPHGKGGANGGVAGPRFTPDHRILTQDGLVRVDELKLGYHQVATSDLAFSKEQRQLILGSMLGDGGLSQRNEAGYAFRCSQSGRRTSYARWKADSLSSVLTFNEYHRVAWKNHEAWLGFTSRHHVGIANLAQEFSRSETSQNGHFEITEKILEELGDLGLAVWVMDDATIVGHTLRLCRTSATDSEVAAGLSYFKRRFGLGARFYRSNGVFVFSDGAYWRLMDAIKPFMHPSVAYKHVEGADVITPYSVDQSYSGVVYETIEQVVPANRPFGNKKMECFRYCLTVPEAGNFLTKVGFVSNCKDTLAVFRAVPLIRRQMEFQGLTEYYDTIFRPFTSDVFVCFVIAGLPMDVAQMDTMRDLFHYGREQLEIEFRKTVHSEAKRGMLRELSETFDGDLARAAMVFVPLNELLSQGRQEEAWTLLKDAVPLDKVIRFLALFEHLVCAPGFNIRSSPDMRRWLYTVVGLTPVKSTNRKADGMPSMSWGEVLKMSPERQRLYMPAVDLQSLKILSQTYKPLKELMDLNVVGNLCKAFLKKAEVWIDPETGEEEVEEAGLHKWLASNGRIHGQTSTTETGRPRGWRPNSLNWPSYVNERIGKAIARVIQMAVERGDLPEHLQRWAHVKSEKDLDSIRSCMTAPAGKVFVESDFKTAEMRALAVISGDDKLMSLIDDPDPDWVMTKDDEEVRWQYSPEDFSGIPAAQQNPEFIMAVATGGQVLRRVTIDDLKRDPETGEIVHCGQDLHWAIVEYTFGMPREMLLKKVHRAFGKVVNFSCLLDSLILTDAGLVMLSALDFEKHKLWDGDGWVSHDGPVVQGEAEVLCFDGVTGTPDHRVWTKSGEFMKLQDAAMLGLDLARTQAEDGSPLSAPVMHQPVYESGDPVIVLRPARGPFAVIWTFGTPEHPEGGFRGEHPDCWLHQQGVVRLPEGVNRKVWLTSQAAMLGIPLLWEDEVILPPVESSRALVYDVINAGPKHRFTCGGRLVSNSAYGATGNSLEMKQEAESGVPVEPGTGDKALEALSISRPRSNQFLHEEMANLPKTQSRYRAKSGRIRHFTTHESQYQVGYRLRNSVESALGRELRNFPMQESVAATAARAGKWLFDLFRALGLTAVPVTILYDSVVTLCDLEERFLVASLHEVCMYLANVWYYDDQYGRRALRYPIDTEFNYRWSTPEKKGSEKFKQLLDATWHPTPPRLQPFLEYYRGEEERLKVFIKQERQEFAAYNATLPPVVS